MADTDATDSTESVPSAASPQEVDERIAPLDFEVDEQSAGAEASAVKSTAKRGSRPVRKPRPSKVDTLVESPVSAESADEDEPETGSKRPKRKQESATAAGGKKVVTKSKKKGKARRRTGPIQFTRESVGELKKVVWPTPAQLRQYFVVVLLFVLFIIAFVGLLDLGFGAALLQLFGRPS